MPAYLQGKFVQNAVKWAGGGKASGIRVAVTESSWSAGVLARLVANVRLMSSAGAVWV